MLLQIILIYEKNSHFFAHILNVKQFYLTQSDATTPGQCGLESLCNEGLLCIIQSSTTCHQIV